MIFPGLFFAVIENVLDRSFVEQARAALYEVKNRILEAYRDRGNLAWDDAKLVFTPGRVTRRAFRSLAR